MNKGGRICETFVDKGKLRVCHNTVGKMTDSLLVVPHSSREFIGEMGEYLDEKTEKLGFHVQTAYENGVPIFCSTFVDASLRVKVNGGTEQMVYAEASSVLPPVVSYVYQSRCREHRGERRWSWILN